MMAGNSGPVQVRDLMRPPRFVPETLSVSRLLRQFQATHQLLAIVVDEYGTTSGIVTLENVLEPIVGPVADEFDVESPVIVPESRGSYLIDGRAGVETVSERLGLALDDEDADTLSGYVMAHLGHVPAEGDRIELEGASLEVLVVRKARAESIRVTLTQPEPAVAADESTAAPTDDAEPTESK
jgi:CBS domain containing-hemolysin-like protein